MKKFALICTFLIFSCSSSFAAAIQAMNKNQVMKALEDKTITTVPLVTLHGDLVANNTVSVYFGKTGELSGQFSSKPDNDPQSDQGTWKVKANGELCVNWKNWTNNNPVCVYTYKLANSLVFINTENKFESMVISNNIVSGNQIHS